MSWCNWWHIPLRGRPEYSYLILWRCASSWFSESTVSARNVYHYHMLLLHCSLREIRSRYMGKAQQPQEQTYAIPISVCSSFVSANNGVAARRAHRCWSMRLYTGTGRESELKVDSARKILCGAGDSNYPSSVLISPSFSVRRSTSWAIWAPFSFVVIVGKPLGHLNANADRDNAGLPYGICLNDVTCQFLLCKL